MSELGRNRPRSNHERTSALISNPTDGGQAAIGQIVPDRAILHWPIPANAEKRWDTLAMIQSTPGPRGAAIPKMLAMPRETLLRRTVR